MNDLIKITTDDQSKQAVSARDLYEFLESKQHFSDWIKNRLEFIEAKEGVDFTVHKNMIPKSIGNSRIDYFLTIETAKEFSMLERNEKGKEARRYFIECEKKLKEISKPQTYIEALRAHLKAEEEKERLQIEKKEKEDNIKRLIHDSKSYTATEIAKELNLRSATALNKMLEKDAIQYKLNGTWVLCAKYADMGYTTIKQEELDNGKLIYHRKWTGEGRDFLVDRYLTVEG